MVLIDKPYVSKFLIQTIKENNFAIVATPEARNLIADTSLHWISSAEARRKFEENKEQRIYTNSENSIGWIEQNLGHSELAGHIQVFKNKIKFRDLLRKDFPGYFYKGVKYEALNKVSESDLQFPLILKPAVGFFSLAVHKVDNFEEWQQVLPAIEKEMQVFHHLYPKEVIDTSYFILEAYIDGEEYAVDAYFDENGNAVLLNILHHVFSSDKDVSDRIYSSSTKIIQKYQSQITSFLQLIGSKLALKNFPLHMEIRIDAEEKIYPIEVNPLRFGGWCTTADLSWFAYGINSYTCFLKGEKPDWERIFSTKKDKVYSIIVLDNNSGIAEDAIANFDYEKLASHFENVLELRKIDVTKYPVFGFVFTETSVGKEQELQRILNSNLREYIEVKNQ